MKLLRHCLAVSTSCLLVLCVLLTSSLGASSGKLKVWAETAKVEYRMCEEIYLFVVVANTTSDVIDAPDLLESSTRNLEMVLVHFDGHREKYHGVSHPPLSDSISLLPNDTVMFPIMLVDCFGKTGQHDELPGCLMPGDYSIEITYAKDYHLEAVKLRVIDTYTQDSLMIDRINRAMTTRSTPKNVRQKIFKTLYDELQGSPLHSRAATLFLSELTRDTVVAASSCDQIAKIMRDNPESGRMLWSYIALLKYCGDSQLKKLFTDHPNLSSNRISRNMLKLGLHYLKRQHYYRELVN